MTNAPFSVVLSNLDAASYQLSARATAETGTSNTAIVSFTVFDALTVQISKPAAGEKFPLGSNIVLQAAIPPTAGAVSNVNFFAGNISIGEAPAPSFTLNWTPSQPGDFILTATASDEFSETATSAPVNVRVFIPESQPPTVRITSSPKNFARLTDPVVSLAGTASDDVGVDRVEVSNNSGTFQTAVGTNLWSADITLAAGLNTVQVRSVDLAGNVSPIVTRFFTFVVDWPLVVQTEGQGTVKPDLNGQLLEIGKAYAIRSKPSPGNIFVRWIATQVNSNNVTTNAVQSSSVTSFIMQSNLMLTAEFTPNPFLQVHGSYTGLMLNSNAPAPESSGVPSLQVADSGAFSGRIVIQGKRFSVSGQFDSAGNARFAIIRPGLNPIAVSLNLDLTNGTDTIAGSATDGNWTALLLANRNVFNAKSNPAPEAGVVQFVFVRADGSNQQEASGTAKISANGNVAFSGALNDGRTFSFSSTLGKDESAPFYVSSTTGNEMLAGWIQFSPALSGRIYWVLAATNGFSIALDVNQQ